MGQAYGAPPTETVRSIVAWVGNPGAVAHVDDPFPFRGEVIWLTPEQGGRGTGVPPVIAGVSYAQIAHVPPHTAASGSASFVLRGWDPGAWRSPAEGRWLLVENEGDQLVVPGAVLVVTEGAKPVALFRVIEVDPPEPTLRTDRDWLHLWVFGPCLDLLATGLLREIGRDRAKELRTGIEGLFRSQVRSEYRGWSPESTTDGSSVDFCRRTTDDQIEIWGTTYLDFDGDVFPFRAVISADEDVSSVELYVGNTDPRTGAPPRYRDAVLVPVRDDDGEIVAAELIVGRRQLAIEWTSVLQISI